MTIAKKETVSEVTGFILFLDNATLIIRAVKTNMKVIAPK